MRLRTPLLAPPLAATLVATALLAAPAPAAAQDAPPPLEGFHAYVADAVDDWGAVGLAVAVVKDGELVFSRGYGERELGEPGDVDASTLFAIGSTTKAFTAATVGILVDEGALDWDDPVVDHLPWFRLADPYLTATVTVRDLLTHRAGLGNADLFWYGRADRSPEEILRSLRHLEPAYPVRSSFVYQNVMYAAAGQVVAAVAGEPWEEVVRRRILQPLGMTRTVMTLAEAEHMANVAAPHDVVDGELRVVENASVDPVAPAGSIWSSVEDMSKWLRSLLGGCVTPDGTALLQPDTCEELFTPQTVLPEPSYPTARLTEPNWTTYGLGWFQEDYEGRKVDFHTGSIDGMVAIAGLIRDEGLGVYVLGNRDHVEVRHALMYRVFDLYDDEAPRDWSTELKALYDELAAGQEARAAAAREMRVEGTEPSVALERYAGTYVDPVFGSVEITWDGDALRLAYGPRTATLEHRHYDTFDASWDRSRGGSSPVTFVLDARGVPASFQAMGRLFRREGGGR